MKINRVTLTGADNSTSYADLIALQKQYQFVEWGILFAGGDRCGTEKYPTKEWIDGLPSELNLSAHFCGGWAREVLEKRNYGLITSLFDFKRVQLNYTFKEDGDWDLQALKKFLPMTRKQVIFQYNKQNKKTLDDFMIDKIPSNVHFLYDSSGGRGIDILDIEPPFSGSYTGYSGGIGPHNIESIVAKITTAGPAEDVYIDMEGKIRTDGKFDLEKIQQVLHFIHCVIEGTPRLEWE